MTDTQTRKRAGSVRSRLVLLLLFGVFLLPVVGAYLWQPTGAMNYGELVSPARPLAEFELRTLEGKSFALDNLKSRWTLVYFGGGACADACRENLYKMRQVQLAQGREATRVERVYVITDGVPGPGLVSLLREHPGLHVLRGTVAQVRVLASQFTLAQGTPLDGLDRVYVVDPLGNLMLSYPADADANRMRKDLARLLRVSQVG